MLLQSHTGEIHLLPALPRTWATGHVVGLKARGGFVVDIDWRDGRLVSTTIHSRHAAKCTVRYREFRKQLSLTDGATAGLTGSNF